MDVVELRNIACDIALDAAQVILKKRSELGELSEHVETKSSEVDPVTIVDKAAESFITQRLAQLRPEDGVLGEEGASQQGTSGITWIVDPIDGTVNFVYGLGHFAVSIAAVAEGEPVAAAVINVANGELFSAARGHGASVARKGQSEPLRANSTQQASHALVATGFSYESDKREKQARIVAQLLPKVRDVRRIGSAALDLCALAAGRVDAYYEHGIHPWDYAAGMLIAREAGAEIHHSGFEYGGKFFLPVFGYAPHLAADLLKVFEEVGVVHPLSYSS